MKKLLINTILTLLLVNLLQLTAYGKVLRIVVDGAISPATSSYIENGIKSAEEQNADALLIELNTPGGLLESTRDIVKFIYKSEVPVIVYVAPGGARAGSAGVFITLAANVAAMAPGTNIGAAHPVGLGGESDSASAMFDKVTNDAAAFIRSIAQKRRKNEDWAEQAVRESISATENEALQEGAIDFISPTADSLLKMADGLSVETASATMTLRTSGREIIDKHMSWKDKLMAFISNPNVAYILILLAMYGIMFELYNPGSIFPGVVGGISAVLAAYSLQLLPINLAGLALMILAVVLFILEIKITSYGLLTISGIVSFILGSTMLIDSPMEFMEISLSVIITASVVTILFFLVVIGLGLKAQFRKGASGSDAMLGESGIAITAIAPGQKGKVKTHGEIWTAEADEEITPGQEVEVISSQYLTIKVKPKIS